MKKLLLTFSALALMASAALAGTGLFGGYIVLTLNGGGANIYNLDRSLGQSFTLG